MNEDIRWAILILAVIAVVAAFLGLWSIHLHYVPVLERKDPEFTLYKVPSKSEAGSRGIDVYKIVGHDRTCYIAGFGASKTLLWCEGGHPGSGQILRDMDLYNGSRLEWKAEDH